MTLATVPRYDPEALSPMDGHAVVVGASMAGLCASRVLADAYADVTVLERDSLPDEPVARRGVPQANHIHVLQEAGRSTLEDLFRGFGEDLLQAGGLLLDATLDVDFYMEGDFLAGGSNRISAYSATRPLYEYVVRRHVRDRSGIDLRGNHQVTDYRLDDNGTTVTGVEVLDAAGESRSIEADLVVDATGRTSHTPAWLADNGFDAPPEDEVHIDVEYSTVLLERPPGDRRAYVVFPGSGQLHGGAIVPVEGDRWLLTLFGMHDAETPTDLAGVREFVASLPIPHVAELLEAHDITTEEVSQYPFPSNLRRRYEDLSRFPDRLVVVGDAIASFNPIYGQGMSVAALEAALLQHTIADGARASLGPRYFDRVADTVDIAWNMAVGSDHQFPQTTGPQPRGSALLNRYLSRLLRKAHSDGELYEAFMRVQGMEEPPSSLFPPSIVRRVLAPSFGR